MSEQDEATKQANAGADNTADQMDNDVTEEQIESIADESARKQLASTAAQKKHWRDKAKALEIENAKLKEASKSTTNDKQGKNDNEPIDREALKQEITENIKLEMSYPDLDESDLRRAKLMAKDEGKSVSEIISDSFFQSYLNLV
jgi:beta-mannanase